MRILVISNFYPPHHIGGYELGCYEAVEELKARGHLVKILTSNYGLTGNETDGQVYRWLHTDVNRSYSTAHLFKREFHNQAVFKQLVRAFKPEIIYVWSLWQVSLSLVYSAHRLGLPVSYYVFDHWVSQWGEADDWFRWWAYFSSNPVKRLIKHLLRQILPMIGVSTQPNCPNLQYAQFASHYLKQQALQAGKPVNQAKVIHWGLNLEQFLQHHTPSSQVIRLLYVGQLVSHKGVHTAIEALKLLLEQYDSQAIELTIVGGTILPDYEVHLKNLVKSFGLEEKVNFAGMLPRTQLSEIYQAHDIMIVPSSWDEPFGIIILEAMASGLAVVGTASGGSAEILQHEVNGLVFPKEDAQACAACILHLLQQPDLFKQLCQQGRRTVEERFQISHTVQIIEQSLQQAMLSQ